MFGLPVLLGALLLGVVLGAVMHRTHFCTMGAVADWTNMGDQGRFGSWLLAIAVATAGVLLGEAAGWFDLDQTRPPYRTAEFAWGRYLLGGALFGVGMTLASGCPTKNLVRLGGGSLKALVALAVAAGCAYLMTRTAVYEVGFYSWLRYLSIDLTRFDMAGQDLGHVLAGEAVAPATARLWTGVPLVLLLFVLILRNRDLRARRDYLLGGVVVGLAIVGGWWLTGGVPGQTWQEEAAWLDAPPPGVATQSFTFVNPLGEVAYWLSRGGDLGLLTFGMLAVFGVVLGAFGYALWAGRLRLEWFNAWADAARHVAGGALMGFGGVLAMGCSVGQGITGVSTLALGSWLALTAIVLASATTMKVQYYRLLYQDASLWDALLSGWVDFRLLPRSLRRLEAL